MISRRPPFRRTFKVRNADRGTIYYDGRCDAAFAFPFVSMNMAYRRRSADRSSWFLKSHVEGPPLPANAVRRGDAGQAPGGRPLLPRRAQAFRRRVPRCTYSYCADRSGDVDAWLRYRVEKGGPDAFHYGESRRVPSAELLGRSAGRIYIAAAESAGRMAEGTRRYREVQYYSLLAWGFSWGCSFST